MARLFVDATTDRAHDLLDDASTDWRSSLNRLSTRSSRPFTRSTKMMSWPLTRISLMVSSCSSRSPKRDPGPGEFAERCSDTSAPAFGSDSVRASADARLLVDNLADLDLDHGRVIDSSAGPD